MRTFIAIELSKEIRAELAQAQSHLRYAGADVKWVKEENIHLTLKFLGEISEEKAAKVSAILDDICKSIKPLEISLKDIGVFPKIDPSTKAHPSASLGMSPEQSRRAQGPFPRVIWVGLDKGAKESAELAKNIDEELSKIGFQKETRPFTSHLTIGRIRSSKNKDVLKEKLLSYNLQPTNYDLISSLILFKSTLTPNGPIYSKLHEAKFQKKRLG